jgi:hypothetical protein
MDQADEELRQTIRRMWPMQAKKMLNLLVPPDEGTFNEIIIKPYTEGRLKNLIHRGWVFLTLYRGWIIFLLDRGLIFYCCSALYRGLTYFLHFTELTYKKLTVGKIYAGLLILENWRAYKANKTSTSGGFAQPVSASLIDWLSWSAPSRLLAFGLGMTARRNEKILDNLHAFWWDQFLHQNSALVLI